MSEGFRAMHSGYLKRIYNPDRLMKVVKRARLAIRKMQARGVPIDAIACRGSSGAALAFPLSALLNIPVLYVRKPRETEHSSLSVEGPNREIFHYIIVDDLISTGNTVNAILDAVNPAQCEGILLYEEVMEDYEHGFHDHRENHIIPVEFIGART